MPLPIGSPSGITAAQPTSCQAPGEDGIVGRVGEDREALVDELLGGAQQLGRVGQERVLVADHLELDPVGGKRLAGELGGEDGVARGVAAGGVGQQPHAGVGEHVDQRAARTPARMGGPSPQRDRHQLAAARPDRLRHQLQRGKAARAEQQARAHCGPGDREGIRQSFIAL